tara:strand:- start:78 stop:764 length:687 start_codon:yes stop_codon:yes gene_type:complete
MEEHYDDKEFLVNAGLLTAAIKTLKPFMSKEETRYYLNGIFFEITNNDECLNMVATDGHKLCVLQVEIDPADYFEGELAAIVPAKALDTILIMIKGMEPDYPLSLRFDSDGKRLWLDACDEKGEFKCVDAEYPKYRMVIPSFKPEFVIGLGKSQANEAMKALSTAKEKEGMLWELKDGQSPLTMREEGKTVVVMPMRVTLPGETPAAPKPKNFDPNQTDIEEHLAEGA